MYNVSGILADPCPTLPISAAWLTAHSPQKVGRSLGAPKRRDERAVRVLC
jgi:hypothetical protein